MARVTADTRLETRIAFWSGLVGSLALAALVHVLAPGLSQDGSLLRMVLVIVFFGCLASASWSLTQPYADCLAAEMRWRYGEAGRSIQQTVERYIIRKAAFMRQIGHVVSLGIGALGLAVLTEWELFAPLAPLRVPLYWLGFAALAATPLVALLAAARLREAVVLKRQIDEEMQISGAALRTADTSRQERDASSRDAVEVTGPMGFRAGGYDWQVSDFYKNAAIFGQSGTGKTICVLNALLDGLLGATGAAGQPAAGLILDPKGDFHDKIGHLARQHGRKQDLLVIDPTAPERSMRWNPLDSDDPPQEIAGRFAAVMEILSPSGDKDAFWLNTTERLVQNLIALLRYARPGEPPSLIEIYEAAMSDEKIRDWGNAITEETYASSVEVGRTFDFFATVWFDMPPETRGTVRSFVSNMLGSFLSPPYDTLFAGRSTLRIGAAIDAGRILYVNMPIADREVMSRVVSTFIKLEFYKEVLKRPDKTRPSFFLCDEFQSFFTVGQGRGDADAFERTRQSNHANIVAFQNLNALFKQTDRKEPVHNLLGNCATKIFLRNTETETNTYASELFGERLETMTSASISIAQGARPRGAGSSISNASQYAARIKKDEFSRLAVPSREAGSPHAEAIAHLAARSEIEIRKMRWRVHPITGAGR